MSDDRRLDLEEIQALIDLAVASEIAELEVEAPHIKVKIKKPRTRAVAPDAPDRAAPERTDPRADVRPGPEGRYASIVAPMVGTFYHAASPDAPPFVQEGDAVEVGQTVCILEAMKLFNEIQSDVAGRVVSVLADNGAAVEYGQPLFLIDPSSA